MIIYLAGLQMVDTTRLEAADIDGATWFQKFRNVTFPLILPSRESIHGAVSVFPFV